MGVFVAYSADSSCWCSHPDVVALKHKDGRVVFAPGLDRHCEQRVKGAGVQHGLQLQDVTDGDGFQLRLGKPAAIDQYIKNEICPDIERLENNPEQLSRHKNGPHTEHLN